MPSKIIIYRDGVGSGDIARLKETEVAAVRVSNLLSGKLIELKTSD